MPEVCQGGKECLEQAGKTLPGRSRRACIHCVKIKMRCNNDKSCLAPPMVQDQKPLVFSSDNKSLNPPLVKRPQPKKRLAQAKKGPVATKKRLALRTPLLAPTPASHPAHHLGKGKGKEVAPPITSSDESEDGYLNPHPPPRPMFHALEEDCGKTVFSPCNAFAYAIQRSY